MASQRPTDRPGMLLIRGGRVYDPGDLGQQDLLIAGGKVVAIEPSIDIPFAWSFVERVDATDLLVLPGLIDGHVHVLGGGGEGGPQTRAPEIVLAQITGAGVTTVVGCLGVDCETRTLQTLLAKTRALRMEGLSAFLLTGGFVLPARTLTGSITSDITIIPEIVGVGEIAIADHRSSQPSLRELAKTAAAAHLGGLLGRKTGTVVLHVGDGPTGLELLVRLTKETELALTQFLPTHVNRNPNLFAQAVDYARQGGYVDVTTCMAPNLGFLQAITASRAVAEMMQGGVDPANITMSSDGNSGTRVFDPGGNEIGQSVVPLTWLYAEFRTLVLEEGIPLPQALSTVTLNPARIFGLSDKGNLAIGADADLLLVDSDLAIQAVYAKGQRMAVHNKQISGVV